MLTCTKTYKDVPFAHRSPAHPGPCRYIHGHSWNIRITFSCTHRDSNGFVIDFGKLGYIKKWIKDNLDHACLLSENDPIREVISKAQTRDAFKLYVLPETSCEGIALHLWDKFSALIAKEEKGRVSISIIDVWEDSKNMARFVPDREGQ